MFYLNYTYSSKPQKRVNSINQTLSVLCERGNFQKPTTFRFKERKEYHFIRHAHSQITLKIQSCISFFQLTLKTCTVSCLLPLMFNDPSHCSSILLQPNWEKKGYICSKAHTACLLKHKVD